MVRFITHAALVAFLTCGFNACVKSQPVSVPPNSGARNAAFLWNRGVAPSDPAGKVIRASAARQRMQLARVNRQNPSRHWSLSGE